MRLCVGTFRHQSQTFFIFSKQFLPSFMSTFFCLLAVAYAGFSKGGARKFENNEDQKKFLHSESVRFSAQNYVKTKKKRSSLNFSPFFWSKITLRPNIKKNRSFPDSVLMCAPSDGVLETSLGSRDTFLKVSSRTRTSSLDLESWSRKVMVSRLKILVRRRSKILNLII